MSQQEGFGAGFLAGAVFGGVVGGVLGTVLATRSLKKNEKPVLEGESNSALNESHMETARRSLEDKIAQLNSAIDDVRQQLEPVNGNRIDQRD